MPNRIAAAAAALLAVPALLLPANVASAASPTPAPSPTTPVPAPDPSKLATFGVQPAVVRGYDPRSFFSWNATPGSHLDDLSAVLNFSLQPLRLRVHVTDALNTDTGGFALLQDSQKPHDVGAWLHIPSRYAVVTVPARTAAGPGVVHVPVRMAVPLRAQPGDHVGGIVVSLVSTARSGTGQRYKLVQRVGSRIFVRVSGPLKPQLTVSHLSASYHGTLSPVGRGTATVSYVVTNSGNVAMGATQQVTVSGVLGSATAPAPARVPLLLPGSSMTVSVRVPGVLPTFVKTATVTLTPLYVPGTLAPAAGPWLASTTFWAIPWPLICLVLLLVVGVLGYTRYRHRRGAVGPPPDEPTVVDRQPQGVPS